MSEADIDFQISLVCKMDQIRRKYPYIFGPPDNTHVIQGLQQIVAELEES